MTPAAGTTPTPAPELPDTQAWLRPAWRQPGIGAAMTTRGGGASAAPWQGFNLGDHVGDLPGAVAANRAAFAQVLGARPVYLRQVHGSRVVRLTAADLEPAAATQEADACVSTEPGLACTILVADCLPVLFAAPLGRAVAAAHAGWRGLAGGVLEATVAALCEAAQCEPAEVEAWLGAAIGPQRFEVGADVLRAFGAEPARPSAHFRPWARGGEVVSGGAAAGAVRPTWAADLAGLAEERLRRAGVAMLDSARACTVTEAERYFSYRRDGATGRMAAAVWIRRQGPML